MQREFKVGLLLLMALSVAAAAVFFVGGRSNLFALKNRYSIRFKAVAGLAADNPVQLNGVSVGKVQSVVLPEHIEEELLTVWITLDRRYAERVRTDSVARIKTLGLLGDKYVEITSGSPAAAAIPSGGEIPAAAPTDVDQLLATGEDVVENVVAISSSLRVILARMEAGEGFLGDILRETDHGSQARDSILGTIDSLHGITRKIDSGQGTLGSLINDRDLAERAEAVLARLEAVTAGLEEGEGAIPALIHDAELKQRLDDSITNLSTAAEEMAVFAAELREGNGLLSRLMSDEEYAAEVTTSLKNLLENLETISVKLDRGDGTMAQILNDPDLYDALDDVVVGIEESKFLRWLVRSRQRKGIKKRYNEAKAQEKAQEVIEEPAPTLNAEGGGGGR